ncbi:MAG TPA: hypothetical protein VLD37_06050 [Candidatus Bilamarchaeum sp.]|nr:hypothetical protein [Candidatus Bilamarchaeum sp.]
MKTDLRLLSFFVLLTFAAFSVPANFQNNHPGLGDRFNTDMQFTTDFTLSVVSGAVASGNPANLQSGDIVCSGAQLQVSPTTNSKWALSSLDIFGPYPDGDGLYFPPMVSSGGLATNQNVHWISDSIYTEHNDFGDSGGDFVYDWSTAFAQDKYNDLGGDFHNEPVSWINSSGTFNNKEAGVNVFCEGKLEINDGATSLSNNWMPTSTAPTFTVNTVGSHSVTTRLNNINCIGVVVKHPLDQAPADHQFAFQMNYYTKNQPSFGASGTKTVSITVQNSGGTVAMHEVQVAASGSLADEDLTMVRVRMHNDGDPIRVTTVSSSNPDFSAAAFNPALCGALGFPPSVCPVSNGFNSDIASGGEKDLYVLITAGAGASGGTILTFTAQTVSTACGGPATGTDTVDLNGVVRCSIDPNSLTLGTLELAQFDVACENLAGDPVSCTGTNWFWADGLAGDFTEKTNTGAKAYTTSPPGASGTLRYKSGIAECLSDIDVTTPTYECEFIPPSATMNVSTSKHFDLNCFKDGSPSVPDSADYDTTDGLGGSTSGGTTTGVNYNAPGSPDSGKLRGVGFFDDAPDPILGAVALAPINVINGTGGGNNTSCPNPNGCGPGGDPGSTKYCTIGSGPLMPFPGFYGWLPIMCGEFANETCTSVTWSIYPPGSGTLSGSSTSGTYVNITGNPGTTGEIFAVVDSEGHGCSKPFGIGEPECWQQS